MTLSFYVSGSPLPNGPSHDSASLHCPEITQLMSVKHSKQCLAPSRHHMRTDCFSLFQASLNTTFSKNTSLPRPPYLDTAHTPSLSIPLPILIFFFSQFVSLPEVVLFTYLLTHFLVFFLISILSLTYYPVPKTDLALNVLFNKHL